MRDYLALFLTKRSELLKRTRAPDGYSYTIATTWELSFQKLTREEAGLLNLCAFLAPEAISRRLLINGSSRLPPWIARSVTNQLEWDEVMRGLRRYSLLHRLNDILRIHRLVRSMLYDRMTEDDRLFWADVAVQMLADVLPEDEDSGPHLAEYDSLLPHVLATCSFAEELKVQPKATSFLLTKVGRYLHVRAQLAESKLMLERALVIAEGIYSKGHPELADVINSLGRTLHSLGDNRQALTAFRRALKDHRTFYGQQHTLVARGLNDFGSILLTLGRPRRAIDFLRQAVATDEALHGHAHPDVARDVGNLGRALCRIGDLTGARAALEDALNICKAHFGSSDPRVATALSNLGIAFQLMSNIQQAQTCFAAALEVRQLVLGKQHPSTVRVRARLELLSCAATEPGRAAHSGSVP